MAEITLAEAKELLKKSSELKQFLLTKFSMEQLEDPVLPSQKEFDKLFLGMMKGLKVQFLDKNENNSELPTARYVLINSDGNWMFDISLFENNKHFWFQYDRVYQPIVSSTKLQYEQIQQLMKHGIEEHLGLMGTTPEPSAEQGFVGLRNI